MNFKGFDYTGTAKLLRRQLDKYKKLNYDGMKTLLYANEVITTDQESIIDSKIGHGKMEYLIVKIIIPSLELGNGKKYKKFLEAMEKSEDTDLQDAAKELGRLIFMHVRRSSSVTFSYNYVAAYIYTYIQLYMHTFLM